MSDYWAVIDLYEGDTAQSVLQKWYDTSTPEQVRKGDMAGASFKYVQLFQVRSIDQEEIYVNVSRYDPFKSVWFLFYTFSEYGDALYVLGGMLFSKILDTEGHLDMCDLSEPSCRNRMFFLSWKKEKEEEFEDEGFMTMELYPPEEPETDLMATDNNNNNHTKVDEYMDHIDRHWFYLPCMFAEQKEVRDQMEHVNAEFWQLKDHVEWILRCERADSESELWEAWDRNGGSPEQPWAIGDENSRCLEFWTTLTSTLIGNVFNVWNQNTCVPSGINIQETRQRWEKAMLFAHHSLFMYRITRYFSAENDLMTLLDLNGLSDLLNKIMTDGNPMDKQSYAKRFPRAPPPEFFFSVSMEELPQELVNQLPMTMNGQGTVNICYKDLPAWLWTKYMIARSMARTNILQHLLTNRNSTDSTLIQLQELAEHISKHFVHDQYSRRRGIKRLKMVANPSTEREQRSRILRIHNPDNGYEMEDMEDLFKFGPPCLTQLKINNRFPKHMERLRVTQILQTTGVSYSASADFFEQANTVWPHDSRTYATAMARFNYENAWKANKGPVYCGNLINNAINKTNEDVLKCPMVAKLPKEVRPKAGQPYQDAKNLCKIMCMGKHPPFKFSGPHDVLKHNLEKKNKKC